MFRALTVVALAFVLSAPPANAAAAPEEHLIEADTLPTLSFVEDAPLSLPAGDEGFEFRAWRRAWLDAQTGDGLTAMSVAFEGEPTVPFLVGYQRGVDRADRSVHDEFENVVVIETLNNEGAPVLGVVFATEETAYALTAFGPDRAATLDKAIRAQMAKLPDSLVAQDADLAEEYEEESSLGEEAGFVFGQIIGGIFLVVIVAWLWRRIRRNRDQE